MQILQKDFSKKRLVKERLKFHLRRGNKNINNFERFGNLIFLKLIIPESYKTHMLRFRAIHFFILPHYCVYM